jgi:hypothetical protein
MARAATLLTFFFLSMMLFSGLLTSTGLAADLGISRQLAGDSGEQVQNAAERVETGAPSGDTLFGLYNVLSNQLGSLFGIINPGLRLLYNAGVPAAIVGNNTTIGFLPPLLTFVKTITIIGFLRGWSL